MMAHDRRSGRRDSCNVMLSVAATLPRSAWCCPSSPSSASLIREHDSAAVVVPQAQPSKARADRGPGPPGSPIGAPDRTGSPRPSCAAPVTRRRRGTAGGDRRARWRAPGAGPVGAQARVSNRLFRFARFVRTPRCLGDGSALGTGIRICWPVSAKAQRGHIKSAHLAVASNEERPILGEPPRDGISNGT
jgi:hypothetical protein